MAWDKQRAAARIKQHMARAPKVDPKLSLLEHRNIMKAEALQKSATKSFPNGVALLVEGAHLYGQMMNFNEIVLDQDRTETEASHRRILTFLNAYYQVWDSIVDGEDAIRVDFHGPRLHAIVVEPKGKPREQVRKAVALADKLNEAMRQIAAAYNIPATFRFGIDHGNCLAMTTGRSHDTDTLFLGRPANHAAKLAAKEKDGPGVHLTDHADSILNDRPPDPRKTGVAAPQRLLEELRKSFTFTSIDAATQKVVQAALQRPNFTFVRPTLPLSSVDFDDLVPSRTIRRGMVSLFADIDGYTKFVDNAMREGIEAIRRAVVGIHTIREELNDVLKKDFKGKRVRFIGDCIHGLMAEGQEKDDPKGTVQDAVECATAMKSSFKLCTTIVEGLGPLDLAIGIEYGPIPLTRIGHPGEESIRCAAGLAVVVSELQQQGIEGGGFSMGPEAHRHANDNVRKYFSSGVLYEYPVAANLLGLPTSPVVKIVSEQPSARSHSDR